MYGRSMSSLIAAAMILGAHRGLPPISFGGFGYTGPKLYGHRGAGISMAQQKRAAKKRRNVAKHKARVRG